MAYSIVQLKPAGINIALFRLLEVEKGEGKLFSFVIKGLLSHNVSVSWRAVHVMTPILTYCTGEQCM
jgi:hypothetical protein